MLPGNLPVATIFDFIIGDFEDTWNAVAASPDATHRGNFMFGLQAMILLEVACRLCDGDSGSPSAGQEALDEFSKSLLHRDQRYFTRLPGTARSGGEFKLPRVKDRSQPSVLEVLWDLIRNGQAHQYQQMVIALSDGVQFRCDLTGPARGLFLSRPIAEACRAAHLSVRRSVDSALCMTVITDLLFLDIRDAICEAKLLERGLDFERLQRPGRSGQKQGKAPTLYTYNSADWERCLREGGHMR